MPRDIAIILKTDIILLRYQFMYIVCKLSEPKYICYSRYLL